MVLSRNDKRKRKEGDIVDLMDPLAQGPKRTKFQAQRKFASVQCSPVVSPAKERQEKTKGQPVCNELITHNRPNTEDFLTFLCYRGTSILPPSLNFFNTSPKKEKSQNAAKSANSSKVSTANSKQTNSTSVTSSSAKKVVPVKEKPVAKKKDASPPKPIQLKTTSTAAQALKKKYQEQRLKKLKPTSMKTRSRGSSDPPKPIAKSVSQKKVVIPKVVKRHSLRSNVSLETETVSPPLKKQSVSQSKKRSSNSKENDDSESSSPKIEKKPKVSAVKSLLQKKLVKSQKVEEEKRVTRSAPRPVSPARRPTRKTKEAAAIYMEILGRKLVGSDLENEDNMSVDSFPELPNARKTAQTENELKLKNRGSKTSKDKEKQEVAKKEEDLKDDKKKKENNKTKEKDIPKKESSVISGRVAKQKPSPGVSLRNKRLTREQISETINDAKIAKRKSLGLVSPLKSKRTARVHKYCELDSEDDEESFTSEEMSSAATPVPKPEVIKTRKSAPAAVPYAATTDNNKKKETTTTTPRSSRSSITSKKVTTAAADAFAKPPKTTVTAAAASPKETPKETAKATKDNKPSPVKRSKEKDKEKAKAKSTASAKAAEESEEEESLSSLIDKLKKKKESEKTSSPAATTTSPPGSNKETVAQEMTSATKKKIKSILDVKLPQRGAEPMKKFVSDDEESFRGFTQRSINGAHALLDEAIGTKNPSILKTHEAMKAQETNKKPDMKAVFGCVLEPTAAAAEKVVVVGSSSSSPTTAVAKLAPKAAAAAAAAATVGTSSNSATIVGNHHRHPVKVESDDATKSASDALLPQQPQQQQLKPQSRCVGSKLTSTTTTTTTTSMPNCGGGAATANMIEMPSSMTMMMMSSHHGHRKERVNMSTEQIEKWLNESSLAKEESKVEMESVASSFKYEPPPITTATATSSSSSSAIAASLPGNNHHHHHHRQHHHYHERYHQQQQQQQQQQQPSPHHQHVHSLPIVTTGHHLSISPRIQHLVRPVNVTLSKLSDRLKHQPPPASATATGSSSFFGRSSSTTTTTTTTTIGGKVTAAAATTTTTLTTTTIADSSVSVGSLSTVALTSTTATTTKTAMTKPASSSRGSSKETTPTNTTTAASYQRKMSKDSSFGDELADCDAISKSSAASVVSDSLEKKSLASSPDRKVFFPRRKAFTRERRPPVATIATTNATNVTDANAKSAVATAAAAAALSSGAAFSPENESSVYAFETEAEQSPVQLPLNASFRRKSKEQLFATAKSQNGGIASDKKQASADQAKDDTIAKKSADSKMTASAAAAAAGKSSKHLNLPQEARKSAASSSGGSKNSQQPTTPKTFELPKNFADLTNIQVLPLDKLTTSWSDVNCSASIAVQVNLDPQLQKSEKSSDSSHVVEAAASSSSSSAAASAKKSLGAASSKPSTKGGSNSSNSTVTAAVAGAGREKTAAAAADRGSSTSSSRTPPKSSTVAVVDQSEDQTTTDDDDNSSGQLFYIPLQAVARNCSAQGGQQLIQGVAVKLGTEGPQGPNQKVLLKAKLVTKPPVTVARCPPIGTVQPTARVTQSSGSQQQVPSTSTSSVGVAAATSATTTDAGFKTPKDRVMKTIVDSKRIHKSPTPEKLVKSTVKTAPSSGVERNKVPADGAKTSSSKKPSSKTKQEHYQPVNATSFPCTQDSKENVKLVEAPIFRPSEKDFQDPLEYIDRIRPIAEKFGICKVVPPANFKPECKVSDDMRFTAYNHYIHRMLNRWGPNVREMMAIKKYLATQSISLTQAPWIGGMEVDLPYLYQTVQTLGGLKEVIEKKKWQKVADGMKIPRSAQDRVTKIDDIYCKYLLPYDTLSQGEREKLFKEVEADWVKKESRAERRSNDESDGEDDDDDDDDSSSEEIEECIVKGRNMPLNAFYRIARNTQRMWFGERQCSPSGESEGASAAEVEAAFWKHVVEKRRHVCVHAASIDSGGRGFGFSQAKNSPFARHPWNLKVLTNNAGSVLRALGPQMGVTVPTLHVGMVFSTCCWYRDPHCLPWIEYLHTGAKKIWYGIPDTESEALRDTLARMFPRYCKSTKIWLPSDTAMVPPDMLVRNGVPLCQTVQEPGQFIVVFPKAFTSSICTGYVVSESVYFAHPSWLDTAEQVFQDLHDSCEPSMFSFEKLLFSIINDAKTSTDVLRQILPSVSRIYNREVENRRKLRELGLAKTEKLPLPEKDKRAKKKALQEEADYECDTCRANLYVSCVSNPTEEAIFCLTHAIPYIERKKSVLKNCTLIYTYSENELSDLIHKLKSKIEAKSKKTNQTKQVK
ncbi:hypothetical protein TKK_0013151 [Trichogramma kaykai]|uniref:ARID domain-containing protein n=1 Tax=Trichogramma kaykai TaxID=54128 RepID=A0ABD2WKD2_9HYME